MRIPIKATKEFAQKHRMTHIVVFAFDGKLEHVATWGKTTENSTQAAAMGNRLKTLRGWPDSTHAWPARLRRLLSRAAELLEREAKCISDSHAVDGVWPQNLDALDATPKADHDELISTAKALRKVGGKR